MEITWYGHSCFRITERGMASVVTDPYDHTVAGYSELSLRADIVTISHDAPGHNFIKSVKGAKWNLDGPGEYEIGSVFLTAVAVGKNQTKDNGRNMVFIFDYDNVTVCHLGDLNDLMLTGALTGVEMGLSLSGIPHQAGGVDAAMRYLAET